MPKARVLILATTCCVLAVATLAVVWLHQDGKSSDARRWPSGISATSLRTLRTQGWTVQQEPLSDAQAGQEGAVVDSVVHQIGMLAGHNLRVSLVQVTPPDTDYNPTPGRMWVLEFADVSIPPMGGADTPGKHSGVGIFLVDAQTNGIRYSIYG